MIQNYIKHKGTDINSQFIKGNPEIYKHFQAKYFRMIYNQIRKMGGDRNGENAKDNYTETILFLFNKIKTGESVLSIGKEDEIFIKDSITGKKAKLSTYLFEVSRLCWFKSPDNPNTQKTNSYLDEYSYQIEGLAEDLIHEDSYDEFGDFGRNFSNLSSTCQMVILLKKVCKVKHEEIAEYRGISHGSARNLFMNCWNNLIKGIAVQRQEAKVKPQKSKMNVFDLLEIFLDNIKTAKEKWLLGELAEKSYYKQLPSKLEKELEEIKLEDRLLAEQIELLNEVISFLDEKQSSKLDFYKQDKEANKYFEQRNHLFEDKFIELSHSSRFVLLLHHVANTDKLKIAEFFELEDDISALKCIHESKLEMMDRIIKENEKNAIMIQC